MPLRPKPIKLHRITSSLLWPLTTTRYWVPGVVRVLSSGSPAMPGWYNTPGLYLPHQQCSTALQQQAMHQTANTRPFGYGANCHMGRQYSYRKVVKFTSEVRQTFSLETNLYVYDSRCRHAVICFDFCDTAGPPRLLRLPGSVAEASLGQWVHASPCPSHRRFFLVSAGLLGNKKTKTLKTAKFLYSFSEALLFKMTRLWPGVSTLHSAQRAAGANQSIRLETEGFSSLGGSSMDGAASGP